MFPLPNMSIISALILIHPAKVYEPSWTWKRLILTFTIIKVDLWKGIEKNQQEKNDADEAKRDSRFWWKKSEQDLKRKKWKSKESITSIYDTETCLNPPRKMSKPHKKFKIFVDRRVYQLEEKYSKSVAIIDE